MRNVMRPKIMMLRDRSRCRYMSMIAIRASCMLVSARKETQTLNQTSFATCDLLQDPMLHKICCQHMHLDMLTRNISGHSNNAHELS